MAQEQQLNGGWWWFDAGVRVHRQCHLCLLREWSVAAGLYLDATRGLLLLLLIYPVLVARRVCVSISSELLPHLAFTLYPSLATWGPHPCIAERVTDVFVAMLRKRSLLLRRLTLVQPCLHQNTPLHVGLKEHAERDSWDYSC